MKRRIYYIKNIPYSHPVHQEFAKSINAKFIKPAPRWWPYPLIPLYNIITLPFNLCKYKNKDIFMCEGFAGLYMSAILKIFKPKISIIYHDADQLFANILKNCSTIKKKYLNFFIKKIDYVISDSNLSKKYVLQYLPHLKKKIKVVYPYVDTKRFVFTPNLNSKKIIFVGRFAEEKNLFTLIDVFEELLKKIPSFKLVMVGGRGDKRKIKRYIKKRKIKNIKFVEWTPYLNKFLKQSLIGYNVSYYEPFGISALEYALSGVLPLIGKNNGNKEIFKNDFIVCDPKNKKEILNKILTYINMDKEKKLELLKSVRNDALKISKEKQKKVFRKAFYKLIMKNE